jgi:glutamate/aspartate transport system permease protein
MYQFDWISVINGLPYLGSGMLLSLRLLLTAVAIGIVIGTVLALMRLSRHRLLSGLAGAYVSFFRSMPLVLVIFWFYFLVPLMLRGVTDNPVVGPLYSALFAFTIFEAAFYCEIIRAGIQSIPRGQISAAYALGLNYFQAMRHVILPQAFRNMVPLLLTQSIVLFQDISLVYVIGLSDFLGVAAKIGQRDGRLVELYLFVAAVYFVLCFAASLLVRRLQRRLAT